jgi:hypothetical protein
MPLPEGYFSNLNKPAVNPVPAAPQPDQSNQVDLNLKNAVNKAFNEQIDAESKKTTWQRLPMEALRAAYEMGGVTLPDDYTWKNMNYFDKWKYATKETIKAIPKNIINLTKAIPNATVSMVYNPVQMTTEGLQGLGITSKSLPQQFDAPLIGTIRTQTGASNMYKNQGYDDISSDFLGFVERALDPTMAYVGFDLAAALGRPRVFSASIPRVMEDLRPNIAEEIKTMQEKVSATAAEAKVVKPGMKTYVSKKNPNVTYHPVAEEFASKFGGTQQNVRLKVSPLGNGQVEAQVIRIDPSLASKSLGWLKEKFGKGNVVKGDFGPEIKLKTTTIGIGDNFFGKTETGEANIPAIFQRANRIAQGGGNKSMLFVSPQVKTGLNFDQAIQELNSPGHLQAKQLFDNIDQQIGINIKSEDAAGDWGDGSENTFILDGENISKDDLLYSGSLKSTYQKQKQFIWFKENATGADELFRINTSGINNKIIKDVFDKNGLKYKTMGNDKTLIFNKSGDYFDSEIMEKLSKAADELGIDKTQNIVYYKGEGDFVGSYLEGEQARQDAIENHYNPIIKNYEKNYGKKYVEGGSGAQARIPGEPGGKQVGIDNGGKAPAKATKEVGPTISPSVMQKPIRGFEDALVTDKQVKQIFRIQEDRGINNDNLQIIAKVISGKNNLNDLTQAEAYQLSESIRAINNDFPNADFNKLFNPSWVHPARNWMWPAEKKGLGPIYSKVYLPIEAGFRASRAFFDGWNQKFNDIYGKYSDPKYQEERRMVNAYIEGDKGAIINNKTLDATAKTDLIKIANWAKDYLESVLKSGKVGVKYSSIVNYTAHIRKTGTVKAFFKGEGLPTEMKPFFEFMRKGQLNPLEDDSLILLQIYNKALGRKLFLSEPYKDAMSVVEKLPPNLKIAAKDYIQEKLGYREDWEEDLQKFNTVLGKSMNKWLGFDPVKKLTDIYLTNTYAAALGLPRVVPIVMNSLQLLITGYPEIGSKYMNAGIDEFLRAGTKTAREKGMLIEQNLPFGEELSKQEGRGLGGKAIDAYLNLEKKLLAAYGSTDSITRQITVSAGEMRFKDNYNLLNSGKITYDQFEKNIDMAGMNPVLQNQIREKLQAGDTKSVNEAMDMATVDLVDRTMFPYRKGSESRAFYGSKGKFVFQFMQWPFEYYHTVKNWVINKQWEKVIRWVGVNETIRRTFRDNWGVSVGRYLYFGPLMGSVLSPAVKAMTNVVSMGNSAMANMDQDLNKNWSDLIRFFAITGGSATGLGVQNIKDFWRSIWRSIEGINPDELAKAMQESGISLNVGSSMSSYTVPLLQRKFQSLPASIKGKFVESIFRSDWNNPNRQWGVYSRTGKLLRYSTFSDLLKMAMGFYLEEESESSKIQSDMDRAITEMNMQKQEIFNKAFQY